MPGDSHQDRMRKAQSRLRHPDAAKNFARRKKKPLPKNPQKRVQEIIKRGHERKGGRRNKTEAVDNALEAILLSDGAEAMKMIESLNAEEQNLFWEMMGLARTGALDLNLDDLWKVDYDRRPPTILEFIDDPYWLGGTMKKTEENEGLWPVWRKVAEDDWDLDSRIHNCVVTGSLGIGKSFFLVTLFLYRIALARLLRNPQGYLGLAKGSKIYYVMLSLTMGVVEETIFGDVQSFMSRSAFFKEECHFDPDKKHANLRIPLGKSIYLTAGSKGWHVIGRNTMGVALDEGNWRLEANPDLRAYALYDEVRTRLKNRFQKVKGFLPALSILSSSAKDESSFTEMVITDIEKSGDRHQRVYRFPVYVAKAFANKYSDEWFKVSYGLKNIDPCVLSGWYSKDGEPLFEKDGKTPLHRAPHEDGPKGSKTELVPGDYHSDFLRNVKTNLQSLSGISTGGSHLLFPSTADIESAITTAESWGIVNPVKGKTDIISVSVENSMEVWDYLDHKTFLTRRLGTVVPKLSPESPRFAHVDLAKTGLAGISICHIVGSTLVEGHNALGDPFSEYRLIVAFDFILTISPGETKPISIEKCQKFFFWLRDRCNYRFKLITYDQYQSEMSLQSLEARGFEVDNLSVDKTKVPYYTVRAAFEEKRILPYRQHQFMREAEALQDGDKKIDHPLTGTKDTADSFCGAAFNALDCKDPTVAAMNNNGPKFYTGKEKEPTGGLIINPVQPVEKPREAFNFRA